MTTVVAVGAITGGINLTVNDAELYELGIAPGHYTELPTKRMEAIRVTLERQRGSLPVPNSGGSVANTTDLMARAGIACGYIGIGGDDLFGRVLVDRLEANSLIFLGELVPGAVTGYDFYLYNKEGARTIILTKGANTLLNPERIDSEAIKGAKLLLLDGHALDFGPESEAALLSCIQTAVGHEVPFVLTLASRRIVNAYRSFFSTYGPKAELLAGNLEQAAVLLGLEPDASLEDVADELTASTFNAIVTLDAAGAFARFGDETYRQSTEEIEAVDSTGAGDNFLGAFLAARLKGLSVLQALSIGNRIAGEVIRLQGARLPRHVDIPDLLEAAVHAATGLDD